MTATRPNPASLWVFDTRPLGRRPGSLKAIRIQAPADQPIGLDVISVPAGEPVLLDLRFESVSEGVLVSGSAAATATGECSRCLIPISETVQAQLRELYAYPGSTTAQTTEEDEIPRLVDDLIDLLPLVTDEIVLALPLVPLCRPDCPGLCPDCGERLDDLEQCHRHERIDPRWAALTGRFIEDGPGQATAGTDPATVPGSASRGRPDPGRAARITPDTEEN